MGSTKRYYTLQEAATALGIPLHQARRWVRQYLSLPPRQRIRLSAKDLQYLAQVHRGFYLYRLRGAALQQFLKNPAPHLPPQPYALLEEIRQRLRGIEQRLAELKPPDI
jgi:DNA-binding transcriptional MerR regulator